MSTTNGNGHGHGITRHTPLHDLPELLTVEDHRTMQRLNAARDGCRTAGLAGVAVTS